MEGEGAERGRNPVNKHTRVVTSGFQSSLLVRTGTCARKRECALRFESKWEEIAVGGKEGGGEGTRAGGKEAAGYLMRRAKGCP